jgi:hypothetical protein
MNYKEATAWNFWNHSGILETYTPFFFEIWSVRRYDNSLKLIIIDMAY